MSPRPSFDPAGIFAVLTRHEVTFVLIGGLAGGARGVGWPTFDADIVVEDEPENIERLARALDELQAVYDTRHQPPIRPSLERLLSTPGPQLFRTRAGRRDVLKEAGGETFETLICDASRIEAHGCGMHCASIAALLRMKRAANRPKDQEAIAKLEEAIAGLEDPPKEP
ncbi:MAG: hypothetical protein AAGF12_08600 [Myxococcota bacterium]